MKKAFTLVELLVVIAIISLLLALSLPALRLVRRQGDETVCQSNLRQLGIIMKTYTNDNDGLFPNADGLFHSEITFWPPNLPYQPYPVCCRWHDARIGFDSAMMRNERPEIRGTLWPYLGDPRIVRCKIGVRANIERGCNNHCDNCPHDPGIDVVPQYTYAMNACLGSTVTTGGVLSDGTVDERTLRRWSVRRETQVTRNPSTVFLFGEQNSWAINVEGRQPVGPKPEWAAPYNLSGIYYNKYDPPGTLKLPALNITPTYVIDDNQLKKDESDLGDAFATCHRPHKGDLNTGFSFLVMLDGHTQKVTVADQLRASRRVPFLPAGRFGPGGNLALAWPVDVPPIYGWDQQ
jgi:prepilin-type N-terminal cleavage/methylation domain-containing protein